MSENNTTDTSVYSLQNGERYIVRCYECRETELEPGEGVYGKYCLNCNDFSDTWEECYSGKCGFCDGCIVLEDV